MKSLILMIHRAVAVIIALNPGFADGQHLSEPVVAVTNCSIQWKTLRDFDFAFGGEMQIHSAIVSEDFQWQDSRVLSRMHMGLSENKHPIPVDVVLDPQFCITSTGVGCLEMPVVVKESTPAMLGTRAAGLPLTDFNLMYALSLDVPKFYSAFERPPLFLQGLFEIHGRGDLLYVDEMGQRVTFRLSIDDYGYVFVDSVFINSPIGEEDEVLLLFYDCTNTSLPVGTPSMVLRKIFGESSQRVECVYFEKVDFRHDRPFRQLEYSSGILLDDRVEKKMIAYGVTPDILRLKSVRLKNHFGLPKVRQTGLSLRKVSWLSVAIVFLLIFSIFGLRVKQ